MSSNPSSTPDSTSNNNPKASGSDSNSDNSGLMSIGMNSFGFNFDESEGMRTGSSNADDSGEEPARTAEQAVAGLGSIIRTYPKEGEQQQQIEALGNAIFANETDARKRKPDGGNEKDDASEDGYKSDNESGENCGLTDGDGSKPTRKKKKLDDRKREERNQREKERSFRISKQITDLRNLLSNGGIVVPKGTKSSVLTEAANYIRILQQHQYRSEIDRHQLIQQMQVIGGGAHGPQAAQAIRHFAAQNGVWSLGNFGGVPPKSAMGFYNEQKQQQQREQQQPEEAQSADPTTSASDSNVFAQNKIESSEYRFIFNSCGVGMAVASMGGAFIDCNQLFCQLSQYTKQEVVSMTIFNLTDRSDLQRAFDQISHLISPPIRMNETTPKTEEAINVTFKGAMKNNSRDDLSLCVSLVKGEDGIAKCFCVTLVKTPLQSEGKPVAASFESIQSLANVVPAAAVKEDSSEMHVTAPAFTSG